MPENLVDFIDQKILEVAGKTLKKIFIYHTVLLLLCSVLLFTINVYADYIFIDGYRIIINAALFGFLGSLIYFSRKCYVYLITNKFLILLHDNIDRIKEFPSTFADMLKGYYLYLTFRPIVGLVIGPVVYMLAFTGLITFVAMPSLKVDLSQSGRYFIYVISFLGGLASSDILDYLSKLAKKIVVKHIK